ncbi:MAG: LamG-like jellyroll fold domain-containing protein [Candidatus Micrarchaeia archaeon]
MALKKTKGILLTLAVIVLLVLIIGELIMYVVLNISYSTISSQTGSLSSTGYFIQGIKSSAYAFTLSSLHSALAALIKYEATPSLRHYHFITNAQQAIESLMYNGTIYGTNMTSYMNSTMLEFAYMAEEQAKNEYLNLTIENSSIYVFQTGPFTLAARYTALGIVNSSYGKFVYPISATANMSLNGMPDLYSIESDNPSVIHASDTYPQAFLVGDVFASSANISNESFVYGTVIKINGTTCANVPLQFRNNYFILVMQNAKNVDKGMCGMGGLITSQINNTNFGKPYLVYPSSEFISVFNEIQNGTKLLISGKGKSLLNITQIKEAIQNNYYYATPYAPSYLGWASGSLNRSPFGIFSFSVLHRYVAQLNTNGTTKPKAFLNIKGAVPRSYPEFSYSAWFYPTSAENYSRIITTSSGSSGTIELALLNANQTIHTTSGNTSTVGPVPGIRIMAVSGGTSSSSSTTSTTTTIPPQTVSSANTVLKTEYIYVDGFGIDGWINTTARVPMNKWNFIAATYNGSTYTVYLDNMTIWKKANVSLSGASMGNMQIGGTTSSYNIGNQFFGDIANVQFYNTSLSKQQEFELFMDGISGIPISNSSLVGWWPLNGNAYDYSGYGNNGTAYNVTFGGLNDYGGDALLWGTFYSIPREVEGINCRNFTSCGTSQAQSLYVGNLTLWSNVSAVLNETTTFNLQNAIVSTSFDYITTTTSSTTSTTSTTTTTTTTTIASGAPS